MGLENDIPADIPELVRQYPTLDEYQARWDRLKDHHARPVPGAYSCDNLVPQSVPELWQDCPFVPFNKLVSAESQARLSVCRPHSSLEEASSTSGVPRYSHITGSVDYRRRAPLQLASLLTEDRSSFWLGVKTPDSPFVFHGPHVSQWPYLLGCSSGLPTVN